MTDAKRDSMKTSNKTTQSNKQWFIENVVSLGLALLIVFMIRSSIVEAFKIPSGSMIPTLLIGDHIFVNKFAYGFKVPFSDWITDHPIYIVKRDPPQRGDVIVFTYPKDESFYYIKRVIGIPGDVIEIRNKMLYINHHLVKRDLITGSDAKKIFESVDDPKYTAVNIDPYEEHLDHVDHKIFLDKHITEETRGPIIVPPDSLFVMGDNRDFSNDSRFWGYVPFKNVRGKAMVIWLSIWVSFSDGQFIFRPSRSGTLIH